MAAKGGVGGERGIRRHFFEIYQKCFLRSGLPYAMAPFIYRCPNTGMNVQGWVADDPTEREGATYADPLHDLHAGPLGRSQNRKGAWG